MTTVSMNTTWDKTPQRNNEEFEARKRVTHRTNDPSLCVASLCQPAPHDETLCEQMGLLPGDFSVQYGEIISEYLNSGRESSSSYKDMIAKLSALGHKQAVKVA